MLAEASRKQQSQIVTALKTHYASLASNVGKLRSDRDITTTLNCTTRHVRICTRLSNHAPNCDILIFPLQPLIKLLTVWLVHLLNKRLFCKVCLVGWLVYYPVQIFHSIHPIQTHINNFSPISPRMFNNGNESHNSMQLMLILLACLNIRVIK